MSVDATIKKAIEEATVLDGYEKGHRFESYAQTLFHPKDFKMLRVTPRRDDLNGRKIEAAKDPDF